MVNHLSVGRYGLVFQHVIYRFTVISLCLSAFFLLGGCGGGATDHSAPASWNIKGLVHGGQQPVSASEIQLYAVGAAGNGSAATPMLTQSVVTDATGSFNITGTYSCGLSSSGTTINGDTQVYIVAKGGNPGLSSGTNNPALYLMAALGPCSSLAAMSYIEINEITTVASAWALAQFAFSPTEIGASSTNASGISNAFADAGLLADTSTGLPAKLSSGLTVETAKLYALANIIATCVNSDGTSSCSALFAAATPLGGTTPSDTLTAALNITQHPGQNVAQIYKLINAQAPFPNTLSGQPNDWTMSLTVTGGGLDDRTALGIDGYGNVWVIGVNGPLAGFNPQGVPLSATGFGAGDVSESYGLAIDTVGDIWVTDYNAPYNGAGAVTKFLGAGSGTPGAVVFNGSNPGFYDSSLRYPYAVSADTNGNIFIANNDGSSATVYAGNGNVVSPGLGSGEAIGVFPEAIAVDSSHGFWLSSTNNTVAHFASDGTLISNPDCCSEAYGLATDANGNVWVADYLGGPKSNGAFAEVSADGTVLIRQSNVGGISYPAMVAIDAAQNVWFTNFGNNSITEVAGSSGSLAAGSAISPGSGVYGISGSSDGGYGLDAGLNSPFGIGPDRSGNVWVSNRGKPAITMFFGLATPTSTPVQPVPSAP